jgi:hypothetical protein
MAGPWLYCISRKANKNFELKHGDVPVSIDTYRELLENGSLCQDRYWRITINREKVGAGDEVYVYAGRAEGNHGIVGYAEVQGVELIKGDWCLDVKFDLNKCRLLCAQPIPAATVRRWIPYPRQNVRDLEHFNTELQQLLPWNRA